LLAAVLALALSGGAGTGQAATAFTVDLQPLIGSTGNQIPQVSYGGAIGYHLFVQNTGDSTTQHVQIIVTSDSATFLDDDSDLCSAYPGDSHKMLCTPPDGTLRPNDTLTVNFRFTAPTTGDSVSTNASIVVAAQSVGGKKNKGTTLATCPAPQCPVVTQLVADGSETDTFLRANENAATGRLTNEHPQKFSLQLPPTLLGAPFGIAVSIHDQVGTPICDSCLTSFTTLSIPAAALATKLGNPLYDGTANPPTTNPYTATMTAKYTPGFVLHGVAYRDDSGFLYFPVASCGSDAPSPTIPVCVVPGTLFQDRNTRTVGATLRGIQNGNGGFG
jgi:hypothetical protein